jgi:hypothetical protein
LVSHVTPSDQSFEVDPALEIANVALHDSRPVAGTVIVALSMAWWIDRRRLTERADLWEPRATRPVDVVYDLGWKTTTWEGRGGFIETLPDGEAPTAHQSRATRSHKGWR